MVRAAELTADDIARWRELAERAIEPNVYLDPRWLLPSLRFHPDAPDLSLVLVEDRDGLRGLLAFTVEPVWQGLPFRAASTAGRFLHMHAERHHPLIDHQDPVATLGALLDGLKQARLPGLVVLHKFVGDGPLATALAQVAAERNALVVEELRQPWAFATRSRAASAAAASEEPDVPLALVTDVDLPTAGAKTVKELRRCARALQRDVDAPVVLADRSADPGAVGRFLELQASGWKGDADAGGLALALHDSTEQWFRSILDEFRSDGELRLFSLEAGDAVLYMGVYLVSGSGVFGFLDSYDEAFRRFGVGHLGRVLGLHRLASSDPARFVDPDVDPFYRSATVLYPDRRDRVNLVIAQGATARAMLHALPAARAIRDRARRALRGGSRAG
ncbi:GNAT family N-acetyltransferase [Microbacterium rhizophilus]|uniref:GNAT family N-acetyltransferase n=1 Tax=Microbacterium rhizophilus TaxID=3138934 RepID=UPI0031EFF6CD